MCEPRKPTWPLAASDTQLPARFFAFSRRKERPAIPLRLSSSRVGVAGAASRVSTLGERSERCSFRGPPGEIGAESEVRREESRAAAYSDL